MGEGERTRAAERAATELMRAGCVRARAGLRAVRWCRRAAPRAPGAPASARARAHTHTSMRAFACSGNCCARANTHTRARVSRPPGQEAERARRRWGCLHPLIRAVAALLPGPRVVFVNAVDFETVAKCPPRPRASEGPEDTLFFSAQPAASPRAPSPARNGGTGRPPAPEEAAPLRARASAPARLGCAPPSLRPCMLPHRSYPRGLACCPSRSARIHGFNAG